MKAIAWNRLGIAAEFYLKRANGLHLTGLGLLMLAAVLWLSLVPYLQRQNASSEKKISLLRQQAHTSRLVSAPVQSEHQARLTRFYDSLGEARFAEQQVKTLLALAAKHGVSVNQLDYKWIPSTSGKFVAMQVSLPLKGTYGAIRQFCEQALLAIPFAALDEVQFKREKITSTAVLAQTRWTIYLNENPVSPRPEPVQEKAP